MTRFLLVLAWISLGSSQVSAATNPLSARYFMSTFRLSADNQLLIASSFDGATWESGSNLYTDSRGLRDPSIIYTAGYYYVAYTILPFSQPVSNPLIAIARSADLIHWTHYTDVSFAAIENVQVVWAPEWFVDNDGSIHILASPAISTNVGDHSYGHDIYEVHPVSNTLLNWSAPAHLTGLPTPTGNPNDGNIDPFLVKKGGTYYLFFIWENFSYPLCLYKSNNLLGPYSPEKPVNTNWAKIGSRKEGESVTQMSDGSWRIYYSVNTAGEQLAWVESYDDWATWSLPTYLTCSEGLNHGTLSSPGANTADSDGNNVPNLMQYALATGRSFSLGNLPATNINAGHLTLSFLRARSDVTYNIEASNDLVSWQTVANNPGVVGQMVNFSDTAPVDIRRRMLRLRVTDP